MPGPVSRIPTARRNPGARRRHDTSGTVRLCAGKSRLDSDALFVHPRGAKAFCYAQHAAMEFDVAEGPRQELGPGGRLCGYAYDPSAGDTDKLAGKACEPERPDYGYGQSG